MLTNQITSSFPRSLCQDLFTLQRTAHRQEEDPRQEAHLESGLQRVLRVRPPACGPRRGTR